MRRKSVTTTTKNNSSAAPYAHWDKQYKRLGFSSQRRWPNEDLIRFLARFYFTLTPTARRKIRVLEMGCGSGANLWMIAKEGFDAYGIDVSSEGLRLCNRMLQKWGVRARLTQGSMLAIPFKDNFFDVVVDVVSLQHVSFSEHRKALREVWRVLKPTGRFFSFHLGNKSFSFKKGGGKLVEPFTIDNIKNPLAPLSGNGLTCFLPRERMIAILSAAGFGDVVAEDVIRTYNNGLVKVHYISTCAKKR